jgi:peroxiredoxin
MTLVLAGCQGTASGFATRQADEAPPAPDSSFIDQQGIRHRLSEFKGRPIVLTEWAGWCPHSQAQVPRIQKELYDRYAGKGVAFVTVEITPATAASVSTFATSYGLTMPLYADDNGSTQAGYPVQYFPTTVFISPDFRIIATRDGEMPATDYLPVLQPYLKP